MSLTGPDTRGRFITIEGGEGAGKSTAMRFIVEWLEQQDRLVVRTREPGGTPLAEAMRELLLDSRNQGLGSVSELLLMFAARAQNLDQVIRPALAAGQDVICDRFTDATYAYQGGGRGLELNTIRQLEQVVHGDLQPDLTLLLDLPVALGLKRASGRSTPDRFEQEDVEFFERVRRAYLARAEAHRERFVVIDASQRLSRVAAAICQALESRL